MLEIYFFGSVMLMPYKIYNGVVTLEIYSTFYYNNYGNYNFIADTQCDHYIFYVKEPIQICMISRETPPAKADFNHAWTND